VLPPPSFSYDFNEFVVIKADKGIESRARMQEGPNGKIIAFFDLAQHETTFANLFLHIKKPAAAGSASLKKKPAAAAKSVMKKPAAPATPEMAEEEDETEDAEEDEEEYAEEDEEEDESQEHMDVDVPPAPAAKKPVAAAKKDKETYMQQRGPIHTDCYEGMPHAMRFYLIHLTYAFPHVTIYLQEYHSKSYTKMYYKSNNCIGIRRSAGKNPQIFSFGGVKCKLQEAAMRERGDECLRKLDAGQSEARVREWARREI